MEEIWKDIIGYENQYQISSKGNVKSLFTNNLRKLYVTRAGYFGVNFHLKGKQKSFYVHRLVAQHFIDKEFGKNEVNHKNGIKTDNCVENLEWNTHSENIIHALENNLSPNKGSTHRCYGKKGADSPSAKLILDLNTGVFYIGAKEAAYYNNYNYYTLMDKLNGHKKNNTSLIYV